MRKTSLLVPLFLCSALCLAASDGPIQPGSVLTLDRCIEIALKVQPAILANESTVEVNRRSVGQAKSAYYPQLDASTGYSRISSSTGAFAGTRSSVATDQVSADIRIQQNIYTFGRNASQIAVQRFTANASISDLENTKQTTVLNVKESYYGVLLARRNRDVAAESVKQYELHLAQAKGFYEVGTKSKYDVTKAEVDLGNARVNLIKAAHTVLTAVATLNNAIGVPDAPEYTIEDNLSFSVYPTILDEALKKANENRQDLKSLKAKIQGAESSVEFARRGHYPSIEGLASYSYQGTGFPLNSGWNVGVSASVPVFDGFLTRNKVGQARASLDVLKAEEESLRQAVVLDVQQSYYNLKDAGERIPAAELAVKQAQENLDIANGRYTTGVGSIIEVTDAEATYANAELAYIQALYDYNTAIAALEKAMGQQ
jgi:outer membrane protein